MRIRVFNEAGIDEFTRQLTEIKVGARKNLLSADLLEDPKLSTPFEGDLEIENRSFADKYEIAAYLAPLLGIATNKDLYYDRGLWTWLSAFYLGNLTTTDKSGATKILALPRYVLEQPKEWRRYYRHLLASAVRLYCELDDLAIPFLKTAIPVWGDFHEQLLAYQTIATNRPLIMAANALYWDSSELKLKKGAGSKGAGSPRRFSAVIGQFELTYDLNEMQGDDIVKLLPSKEFVKWAA